jgi:hypothetical protein
MNDDDLEQVWHERLDDLAQSGMGVRQWLEHNGYSKCQYGYWRRKLANDSAAKNEGDSWISVPRTPFASDAPSGLTVCIAGAAIEVVPGFDPSLLRAVVLALRESAC